MDKECCHGFWRDLVGNEQGAAGVCLPDLQPHICAEGRLEVPQLLLKCRSFWFRLWSFLARETLSLKNRLCTCSRSFFGSCFLTTVVHCRFALVPWPSLCHLSCWQFNRIVGLADGARMPFSHKAKEL